MRASYIARGNVQWYSHFGKLSGVPQKVLELTYDPAIPLPGIYPREMKPYVPTKTVTLIAAFFIIIFLNGKNPNVH